MSFAADGDFAEQQGIVPTWYGYRVRSTDAFIVEVLATVFNWRLVVHQHDSMCEPSDIAAGTCASTYEHGFCYFGRGLSTLAEAVAAGLAWEDPVALAAFGVRQAGLLASGRRGLFSRNRDGGEAVIFQRQRWVLVEFLGDSS
jgi:hypothetical protein